MPTELKNFIAALSPSGRRVIANLISRAPHMDRPFPCVVSQLRRCADCCKLTVLRNLTKAEKAGLMHRETSASGHRYGSMITLHASRCTEFMELYENEHGPVTEHDCNQYAPTEADRYQHRMGSSPHNETIHAFSQLDISCPVDELFMRLSDQGKRVLSVLSSIYNDNGGERIHLFVQHTARQACCSEVTARRVLRNAQKAGIFKKDTHQRGPRYGVLITPDHDNFKRLNRLLTALPPEPVTEAVTRAARYQHPVTGHDRKHECHVTDPHTAAARYAVTDAQHMKKTPERPDFTGYAADHPAGTHGAPDRYQQAAILDREIKILSNAREEPEEDRCARRLLAISADYFQVLWPRLHRESFGPDQIRQIVQHRFSFDETVLDIENSLHAAEYELEQETFPKARKGICNYLFATLKNKGCWRRPPGFKTPGEQALANAEKELNTVQKLKELEKKKEKQAEQDQQDRKFETWLGGLTEKEIAEIDEGCALPMTTDVAKRSWRKRWWIRNAR